VLNERNKDKELVSVKGGFIPKKYAEREKRLNYLISNPPKFDPLNKKRIKDWFKEILILSKKIEK